MLLLLKTYLFLRKGNKEIFIELLSFLNACQAGGLKAQLFCIF
ncbi:hypothetical protein DB44_AN00120 [Candidatus Protochlamydia amoebophila]|uniref:Uncharacterized protein n=1 Tax=Candidatus Protochlamydia amoebophila TaxID=362787 RepID=A0A0C1K4H6_9BACT|nr:hypothetical protein DB44_AN00120 [Candidatus Protochlamydia amoebophila]